MKKTAFLYLVCFFLHANLLHAATFSGGLFNAPTQSELINVGGLYLYETYSYAQITMDGDYDNNYIRTPISITMQVDINPDDLTLTYKTFNVSSPGGTLSKTQTYQFGIGETIDITTTVNLDEFSTRYLYDYGPLSLSYRGTAEHWDIESVSAPALVAPMTLSGTYSISGPTETASGTFSIVTNRGPNWGGIDEEFCPEGSCGVDFHLYTGNYPNDVILYGVFWGLNHLRFEPVDIFTGTVDGIDIITNLTPVIELNPGIPLAAGTFIGIPPTADLSGPYTGTTDLAVSFDGSASSDPDGNITAYAWEFGDGGTGAGVNPMHIYTSEGIYDVSLTVTDNDGISHTATTTATINDPLDSDYDGLFDHEEDINGNGIQDPGETDFLNPDSDGDGMTDGYEIMILMTDPVSQTPIYTLQCDINEDGNVNLGDLLLFQRQLLGYPTP